MPFEVRHYDPTEPTAPPFEVERFPTEAEAWEAYADSAQTVTDVGGCVVLVDVDGIPLAKTRKLRGSM